MALQIGMLVAFTQLIPEHQVQLFGVLKARVKVCFNTLVTIIILLIVHCDWFRRCLWRMSLCLPLCVSLASNAPGS